MSFTSSNYFVTVEKTVYYGFFRCQCGWLYNYLKYWRSRAWFWMVDDGSCSSVGLWRVFLLPFLPNIKLRRWVTGWTLNMGSKQWHPPFMVILLNSEGVRKSGRRVFIWAPWILTQPKLIPLTVLRWGLNSRGIFTLSLSSSFSCSQDSESVFSQLFPGLITLHNLL